MQGVVAEGRRQRRARVPGDGPARGLERLRTAHRPAAVEALALQDRRLPRRVEFARPASSMEAIVRRAASCAERAPRVRARSSGAGKGGPAVRGVGEGVRSGGTREPLDQPIEPGKGVQRRVVDVRPSPTAAICSEDAVHCYDRVPVRGSPRRDETEQEVCCDVPQLSPADPWQAGGPPPARHRRSIQTGTAPCLAYLVRPAARGPHRGRSVRGIRRGAGEQAQEDADRVRVDENADGCAKYRKPFSTVNARKSSICCVASWPWSASISRTRPSGYRDRTSGAREHPFAVDLPALAQGPIREEEAFGHRDRPGERGFGRRNEWCRGRLCRGPGPGARRCDPRPLFARTAHRSHSRLRRSSKSATPLIEAGNDIVKEALDVGSLARRRDSRLAQPSVIAASRIAASDPVAIIAPSTTAGDGHGRRGSSAARAVRAMG